MKKFLLACLAGAMMFSGLDAVRAKGKTKAKPRSEQMKEKREKKNQEFADALEKIETSIKDVKDEKTKAALESIYAYLSMKHDMKKEWMGRSKGRKPASRALKKPAKRAGAKRGASVPQRKRARFQSGD